MIRRPPRSTQSRSSAASDVYKRQVCANEVVVGLSFFYFIVAAIWTEMGFTHRVQLYEQLQGAIHGRDVDMWEILLDAQTYLISPKVIVTLSEDVPDQCPLWS